MDRIPEWTHALRGWMSARTTRVGRVGASPGGDTDVGRTWRDLWTSIVAHGPSGGRGGQAVAGAGESRIFSAESSPLETTSLHLVGLLEAYRLLVWDDRLLSAEALGPWRSELRAGITTHQAAAAHLARAEKWLRTHRGDLRQRLEAPGSVDEVWNGVEALVLLRRLGPSFLTFGEPMRHVIRELEAFTPCGSPQQAWLAEQEAKAVDESDFARAAALRRARWRLSASPDPADAVAARTHALLASLERQRPNRAAVHALRLPCFAQSLFAQDAAKWIIQNPSRTATDLAKLLLATRAGPPELRAELERFAAAPKPAAIPRETALRWAEAFIRRGRAALGEDLCARLGQAAAEFRVPVQEILAGDKIARGSRLAQFARERIPGLCVGLDEVRLRLLASSRRSRAEAGALASSVVLTEQAKRDLPMRALYEVLIEAVQWGEGDVLGDLWLIHSEYVPWGKPADAGIDTITIRGAGLSPQQVKEDVLHELNHGGEVNGPPEYVPAVHAFLDSEPPAAFLSPYVLTRYPHGETEFTPMGMQWFTSGDGMAALGLAHLRHLEFCTGRYRGPPLDFLERP